jgi:hypothetical protein
LPRSILFSSPLDFWADDALLVCEWATTSGALSALEFFSFLEIRTMPRVIKTPTAMPATKIATERCTDHLLFAVCVRGNSNLRGEAGVSDTHSFGPTAVPSPGRQPDYKFHTIPMVG